MAVDLNGGTAGTAFTYATNPTSSRYLGIAMANNLPDTGAIQTDVLIEASFCVVI